MPTGNTTTSSLADSLPIVIDGARIVREYEGVYNRVVDKQTLPPGTGLKWDEISLSQLSATQVSESTVLDNPQQLVDDLFSIAPTVIGIQTLFTDRVQRRIAKVAWAKTGTLAQNAMNRKKDEDFLTVLDGATTSLGGAGTTNTFGLISAAVSRITGNTVEPASGTIFAVLHPFQIKDIQDEIVAGVGTYTVPAGMTEDVYRKGFSGMVANANVFADGNLTIDAADDAKGGVFAREAIVLVQGHSPRNESRRRPEIGGGADEMFIYDEFGLGERSAGNWLYEIYTDSLAPTT